MASRGGIVRRAVSISNNNSIELRNAYDTSRVETTRKNPEFLFDHFGRIWQNVAVVTSISARIVER